MKYEFWLANVRGKGYGIGNSKIQYLYEKAKTAEEIYYFKESDYANIYGITEQEIAYIIKSKQKWDLDGEWGKFQETGIGFVTTEQAAYPLKLRSIANPPYCLFYLGELPSEKRRAVAMVGARNRSAYGSEIARKLSEMLANSDIDIISGMARGIDADSHVGALNANGKTYAVLGCGIDICYPKSNRYLYDKIKKNGGIISEYPLGTPPDARLFPQRNRIISGLADYVVVVEAKIKSGSLITADFAIDQGKEVYAVPGRITDALSEGCNNLIRQGAGTIVNLSDFVKDVSISGWTGCFHTDYKKILLEKDESLVYSLLDFCPMGIGTIMEKVPYQLIQILEILDRLERKELIKETIPNYYVRTL